MIIALEGRVLGEQVEKSLDLVEHARRKLPPERVIHNLLWKQSLILARATVAADLSIFSISYSSIGWGE